MALTQSDLDALDSAIARAELEVEIDGQRIRYRSTADLLQARAFVASVVASAGNTASRTGYNRVEFATLRGD